MALQSSFGLLFVYGALRKCRPICCKVRMPVHIKVGYRTLWRDALSLLPALVGEFF